MVMSLSKDLKKPYTISLDKKTIDMLNELSRFYGISKSALIRQLIVWYYSYTMKDKGELEKIAK